MKKDLFALKGTICYSKNQKELIFAENSYAVCENGLCAGVFSQLPEEYKDIPVKDRKPIKIFINSNGGSLNSIMELITICNLSKTPVYAIGMGKCYSAGGLLLMGVPKGNRYILNTTEALIHDGSTGTFGDTGKVLDDLEYTRKTEEFTKKFILDHTDIPENEYDKNYRRNWWLDSNEIIKYGVADKIIENIDELF